MNNIDEFDRKILTILQRDGSTSFGDLGAAVGLSSSACHKRVASLRAAGVIAQTVSLVDEQAAGLAQSVYVQATLKNQKRETLSAFEEAVARRPEVMECYLMGGLSDYLLRILCRDGADYERLHTNVLTQLPGVDRLVSNFAIRKVLRRTALPI